MNGWARWELSLALTLGVANVLAHVVGWGKGWVLALGALAWGGYVLWRLPKQPELARRWGFRWDTAGAAARTLALPVALAVVAMLAVGWARGQLPPPPVFWGMVVLYPVWGLTQQFFLNAMVVRNLAGWLGDTRGVVAAAVLFALSHAPDWPLVALTLPAGVFFAWVYLRHPNLFVLGLAHGVLGALAWTVLLGRHPLVNLQG